MNQSFGGHYRLNNNQGWEKEKTKGRIITKPRGKEKTQGLVKKTREGTPTTVLIITRGLYPAAKSDSNVASYFFLKLKNSIM